VFMLAEEPTISLTTIEAHFLQMLGAVLADLVATTLENLDVQLRDKRDKVRYELIDVRHRTIETVLGQPVTFGHRYYRDNEAGGYAFLLDLQIGLDENTRTSPLLHDLMIRAGIASTSYRIAAEGLTRVIGAQITTHETIRQYALKAGKLADSLDEQPIEKADGKRKAKVLFMEADGVWMNLQRSAKRSIEERMLTVHEGWAPLQGNPSEFGLQNSSMWSSHEQGEDWWDTSYLGPRPASIGGRFR